MQADVQPGLVSPHLRQKALLRESLAELAVEQRKPKQIGLADNLKEGVHYAWISEQNVAARKAEGYDVVRSKVKKGQFGEITTEDETSVGLRQDGTHKYNDTVLMCIPKDAHQKRLRLASARSAVQLQNSREGVLREAHRMGIPASKEV